MKTTVTTITCDITKCKSEKTVTTHSLQVIMTTEQTEGRSHPFYLNDKTLDLCKDCFDNVLNGHYVYGAGAMGFNDYWFNKKG